MICRAARLEDCAAIAEIYSAGIRERIATFETEPRSKEHIEQWFSNGLPKVVIGDSRQVIGFAAAFPYSDRCCYAGVVEFSVYVSPLERGRGVGKAAMLGLIEAVKMAGIHKLTSRVLVENLASLGLLAAIGFRQVGVLEKHGKLEGQWRDVVQLELLIPENL